MFLNLIVYAFAFFGLCVFLFFSYLYLCKTYVRYLERRSVARFNAVGYRF